MHFFESGNTGGDTIVPQNTFIGFILTVRNKRSKDNKNTISFINKEIQLRYKHRIAFPSNMNINTYVHIIKE